MLECTRFVTRLVLLVAAAACAAQAQNLTDDQLALIEQRLADGATHTWELGTRSQTLLELHTPSFSVLNDTELPPSRDAPSSLQPVLEIAFNIVSNRSRANDNTVGPQPLIPDGSAADPASNGVSVAIADWTGQGGGSVDYAGALRDQVEYLLTRVPKTDDGAISHREEQVQLWSDYVYMVPPTLAYYGVLTRNRSLVAEAYNQVRLYRQYLRDADKHSPTFDLWRHIALGRGQDPGIWATGNGWAAAGMLRVLGTIQNSEYRGNFKHEMRDLRNWVNAIHDAIYEFQRSDGLFNNYVNDSSSFADASSTALVAATVYRLALLTDTHKHLPDAESARLALLSRSDGGDTGSPGSGGSGEPFSGFPHFTADGWIQPVVNPLSFRESGEHSPEGQSFVLQMHAAWRDWVGEGADGANAGMRVGVSVRAAVCAAVVGVLLGAMEWTV